jgi:hypothetical protein
MIARLEDETVAAEALLSLDDLPLVARVAEASASAGLPPGAYAAGAVGRFVAEATDEEWLSLIGAMGRQRSGGRVPATRVVPRPVRLTGSVPVCAGRSRCEDRKCRGAPYGNRTRVFAVREWGTGRQRTPANVGNY